MSNKIYDMKFKKVFQLLIDKAEKKGKTRQEGKSRLSVVSVVCIAIFSFVFLAGEVLKVANNFT